MILDQIIELSLRSFCLSLEGAHFCVPKSPNSYNKILLRQNEECWSDIGVIVCLQ